MDGRTAGPLHASPGEGRAGGLYDQGGLQDGATDGGGPRTDRLNAWANSQTAGEWEGVRGARSRGTGGREEGFSGKIFVRASEAAAGLHTFPLPPNRTTSLARGAAGGRGAGGRVPGVNSSSPVASTVCSRRRRRRPKVWSPENSKRETARRRRRRHLSLPSSLRSFGLSQACAGGGRPPTSFARSSPLDRRHSNLRLFEPHHLAKATHDGKLSNRCQWKWTLLRCC